MLPSHVQCASSYPQTPVQVQLQLNSLQAQLMSKTHALQQQNVSFVSSQRHAQGVMITNSFPQAGLKQSPPQFNSNFIYSEAQPAMYASQQQTGAFQRPHHNLPQLYGYQKPQSFDRQMVVPELINQTRSSNILSLNAPRPHVQLPPQQRTHTESKLLDQSQLASLLSQAIATLQRQQAVQTPQTASDQKVCHLPLAKLSSPPLPISKAVTPPIKVPRSPTSQSTSDSEQRNQPRKRDYKFQSKNGGELNKKESYAKNGAVDNLHPEQKRLRIEQASLTLIDSCDSEVCRLIPRMPIFD